MELRDALFAALRYELTETLPAGFSFDGIDETFLKELYDYSNRQEVAHLVGDALERLGVLASVSDEVAEPFRRRQAVAAYHAEQQRQVFEEVSAAFEAAKIPYLPLKGLVIRPLYPEPWMRTAGDLDILVKVEDLVRAEECLFNLGAKKTKEAAHNNVFLFSTGTILELHFCLFEDNYANAAKTVFDNIWTYVDPVLNRYQYVMKDEWFYCYYLAHMAKHFQVGACGIRPFLDLWILNHTIPFDSEKRRDLLGKCGLLVFADKVEYLSEIWISAREHDEWTRTLEHFLLAGGAFGNDATKQIMQIYEKQGRVRYYLSHIFLSFDMLKKQEKVLEKYPILYPFCQIKRWCRVLFGKRLQEWRGVAQKAKQLNTREHTMAELREYLGLLRKDDLL